MRALLAFPLVAAVAAMAACAGTSPKDLEKMSTVDVCYLGIVEPDQRAMVDAEIQRRRANCADHEAELKKMADEELRAGGSGPQGTDAAKSSGYGMGGASSGGMGRGSY